MQFSRAPRCFAPSKKSAAEYRPFWCHENPRSLKNVVFGHFYGFFEHNPAGKVQNSKKYHINPLQNFDARLNHHRTGGRKSKTWDEIAFESQLFQPPIRLAWAAAARAVSQHWTGRFSRNKDQSAPSGGARPPVVVGRPKNRKIWTLLDMRMGFRQKKHCPLRSYFSDRLQRRPKMVHEKVPV
jgi:hypothetical protein